MLLWTREKGGGYTHVAFRIFRQWTTRPREDREGEEGGFSPSGACNVVISCAIGLACYLIARNQAWPFARSHCILNSRYFHPKSANKRPYFGPEICQPAV